MVWQETTSKSEQMIKKIPIAFPDLSGNELNYLTDCIKTSWISSAGPYIKRFEEEFASYCDISHGIATSNGTVALHLALTALGISKDDEVIVPSLTFVASANSIRYCGAKPVFVDSDPHTWNMDVSKIENLITPKTRAIMPVHLYGNPCNMKEIRKIADEHGLFIVEDAAEAHGATYRGEKVGSLSDIGCFSFFGNKIISTGEGGMCITNDEFLAEKMRKLKDHGMSKQKKYWHDLMGFNYRMTNLQAAVGLAQLERIDYFLACKRMIFSTYRKHLAGLKGIHFQKELPDAKSVYWMVSLLFDNEFGFNKQDVANHLEENGVETRPVFYPIHHMPPYKEYLKMPICEWISKNSLTLPSFVGLDEEKVKYICEKIIGLTNIN